MKNETIKRLVTSFFLINLLCAVFIYSYILIISLIIVSIISLIEFLGLVSKIFTKNNIKTRILKFLIKALCLIYLTVFFVLTFNGISDVNFKLNMIYLFAICISSDVGGLIFGKTFKGKKLTKISPNKTISGSIGSFILSLILVPFFYFISNFLYQNPYNIFKLIIVSIIVSFSCQLGDLFISFLKRKAKVKDTGDLLPGHGGVLDRIDGILFAIPVGFLICKFLIISI